MIVLLVGVAASTGEAKGQTAAEDPTDAPVLGAAAGWAMDEESALIEIRPGSVMRRDPLADGEQLAVVSEESRLPALESWEQWVRVRYGDVEGWIDLDAEPVAVRPTFAPSDSERELPGDVEINWTVVEEIGPYRLSSKVEEDRVLELLRRVAEQHTGLYRERFGLPVEDVEGEIYLFEDQSEYSRFLPDPDRGGIEVHGNGFFYSPRTVVMYRGELTRQQLAATLAHELTHLLSWNLLPTTRRRADATFDWWLEEGMAEDVALSRFDRKGRWVSGPLLRDSLRYGPTLGPALITVERELIYGTPPDLTDLAAMNAETCCNGSGLSVLLAALWVRYLVEGQNAEAQEVFKEHLAATAGGRPVDWAAWLQTDAELRKTSFRQWVRKQRVRLRPGVIMPE